MICGELDSCMYLMENTRYALPGVRPYGYWLETLTSNSSSKVWRMSGGSRFVDNEYASVNNVFGIRPVIEVSKKSISY